MITGDYNIVNVDFFVEYKISDPVAYLYASDSPELVLKNLGYTDEQVAAMIAAGEAVPMDPSLKD